MAQIAKIILAVIRSPVMYYMVINFQKIIGVNCRVVGEL